MILERITRKSTAILVLATALTTNTCSDVQAGELLVADRALNRIVAFDPDTGAFLRTVVSTGLDEPTDLAFGPGGALYVADRGSGNILRFDPVSGASLDPLVAGNPVPFASGINEPSGLLHDVANSQLMVAEFDNFAGDQIFRFNANGSSAGVITTAPVGHYGLTFGPDRNLYASDFRTDANFTGTVSAFDATNNYAPLPGPFASGGGLFGAAGVAFGPDGNFYVASLIGQSVVRYTVSAGAVTGSQMFGPNVPYPADLLFTANGDLLVSSLGNSNPSDPIYGNFLFPGAVYRHTAGTGAQTVFTGLGNDFQPTALLKSPFDSTGINNLGLQLGGATAARVAGVDYDQVVVPGSVTLAGALTLTSKPDLVDLGQKGIANPNDHRGKQATFTLIDANQSLSGAFQTVTWDGLTLNADEHRGLFKTVSQVGNDLTLTLLNAKAGDADGDRIVSATDVFHTVNNLNTAVAVGSGWQLGNFDSDAIISASDVFIAVIRLGAYTPTAASGSVSSSVPEPATWPILALIGGMASWLRRRPSLGRSRHGQSMVAPPNSMPMSL